MERLLAQEECLVTPCTGSCGMRVLGHWWNLHTKNGNRLMLRQRLLHLHCLKNLRRRSERARAIDLSTQLPAPALGAPPFVVAFADVVGVIFLKTTGRLYTFDLKTGQSIRVMTDDFYDIIPYVSFYTPVLRVASTGEGPSGGASTA
ncbi:uncharacterized protein [Miscanthus floridulus]|uniref:uncharacterized protein n=1 Tax=Miscanthus floridulus TaxID=154761 RepID=UPI00345ABBE1